MPLPSDDYSLWKIISLSAILGALGGGVLEIVKELIKAKLSTKGELKKKWLEKRNERRITIYEQLYTSLDSLTDWTLSSTDLVSRVESIELTMKRDNLYIDASIKALLYDCCDYFKKVSNGNINRDAVEENNYLERFKNFFNQ